MNNLQSALFNYLDWLVDPLVRSLDPATRDAYAELIWRSVAAWDDGFIAGPRDTRANVAVATATAGTTPDRMQRLLDLGLVEVIDGAVFVQRGLDLLADQDTRRHRGARGGKAPRKNRPKPSQAKSTQVQSSKPESTQVNSSELDGTRTGQDRTGQDVPLKGAPVAKAPKHPPKDKTESLQVFQLWQELWNHPDAKLTDQRETKIRHALKAYGLDYCMQALQGWRTDDWAERHARLDRNDLTVIFRDLGKVEQGNAMATAKPAPNGFRVPTSAELFGRYSVEEQPRPKTQDELDDEEAYQLPQEDWDELQAPPYHGNLAQWKAARAQREAKEVVG